MLNNGSQECRCYGSSLTDFQQTLPVPFERVMVVRHHQTAFSLSSKNCGSGPIYETPFRNYLRRTF